MNIISFGLISETMNGVVCRFNSKLATSSVQLGFTAEGMYVSRFCSVPAPNDFAARQPHTVSALGTSGMLPWHNT